MQVNLYLSIIIPVYKSEAYLSKCIESVLNQDYDLYEVILINDGSPDNCGSICDLYASNNAKVSVIHQNNLGVSAARNNGIQKAKGKYIWFVDSDDWIENNCFSSIVSILEKEDLDALQIGYYTASNKGVHSIDFRNKIKTNVCNPIDYVNNNLFIGAACCTIFKRRIIIENNTKFNTKLKLAEDQLFMLTVFKHCKKVKRENIVYYYYFQNSNSAVHNFLNKDLIYSIYSTFHFEHRVHFEKYCIRLISMQILLCLQNPISRIEFLKINYFINKIKNNSYYGSLFGLKYKLILHSFRINPYLIIIFNKLILKLSNV